MSNLQTRVIWTVINHKDKDVLIAGIYEPESKGYVVTEESYRVRDVGTLFVRI
ncbi:MAG: hypothetical protein LBE91_08090 [Tannerella sp.]|nr:hypothetical protein [Tannerella sp.]